MSDLAKRLLLALGLTVAADLLLFAAAPGVGLTVFALLTAVVLAAAYHAKLLRAQAWLGLWLVLAVNTAFVTSLIGSLLLIALTWIVLAMALMPERPEFFNAVLRGLTGGVRSYTLFGSDLRRYVLISNRLLDRRGARTGGFFKSLPPFWVIALPAGLILIFAILIIPANLVLAEWTENAFSSLWRVLTSVFVKFEFARITLWIAIGLGAYGLLRFRLGRHPAHHPRPRDFRSHIRAIRTQSQMSGELLFPTVHPLMAEQAEPASADPRHELLACLYTFAGLNLLYALANITDLFYIWLHFELPAAMTYAQFAHHGSYRLIVAVVLAAVLVPAFYRIGVNAATHPRARWLAFGFIAQNLVVLLGAARRLMIYDEVYGLSRFRVATYLWLALVFIGFVLTWIKVAKAKPFRFLLQTNAIATVLLLAAIGWLNLDGFIADWNVSRFQSGATKKMDVRYLAELDSGALPALARLTKDPHLPILNAATDYLTRRLAEEKELLKDWRNWTWQRAHDIAAAEAESGR